MHEKALCKIDATITHNRPKTTSEQNLAYFNRNPIEFLRRFATMDETWIRHYTSESHEGSKQWVKYGENVPKRPKTQQSSGKVMASVFGKHMECNDFLGRGRTITGAYRVRHLDLRYFNIE